MKKVIITNDIIIWAAIIAQIISLFLTGLIVGFGGVSIATIVPFLTMLLSLWISISFINLMKAYQQRLLQSEKT